MSESEGENVGNGDQRGLPETGERANDGREKDGQRKYETVEIGVD